MLDIGWTELLVIGVVALIVVGPKDLPKMFRTLGQFTAKARNMAREFQRAMDDAADESGVKDMARDLRGMTDPKTMGLDELNKMKNWDPLESDAPAKGTPKPASAPDTANDMDGNSQIAADQHQDRRNRAQTTAPDTAAPEDDTASKV
ncbi:Sec-independent protein translocase protein TatB [Roseinatronobacter sp. NSM]|uniref:Sec-independent protein translocase protein TatB n=1 Tax=Roseinatronobacter sp. NSM TaxID=3457785 RepID=UPI004035FABA